jgi:hypothetical protein
LDEHGNHIVSLPIDFISVEDYGAINKIYLNIDLLKNN